MKLKKKLRAALWPVDPFEPIGIQEILAVFLQAFRLKIGRIKKVKKRNWSLRNKGGRSSRVLTENALES